MPEFLPDDAKLAALAEFAAGAGHEINNPAAAIAGRVALLLRRVEDPDLRRDLAVIGEQAYRIRDMIGDAMTFARPPDPVPTDADLAEVAAEALAGLEETADRRGVALVRDLRPTPVWGDPTQLAVVAAELVRNGVECGARAVRVSVVHASSVHPRAQRAGGGSAAPPPAGLRPAVHAGSVHYGAALLVSDDGPGFSDVDREHAFDPFYSGRQAGRGLGFGLPKVWRIVTLHGGTIAVTSRPGETVFRVTLPAGRDVERSSSAFSHDGMAARGASRG